MAWNTNTHTWTCDLECPQCGEDAGGWSTENEWDCYCPKCNIRFKVVDADANGVFHFPAEDANRSILYEGRTAYVAYDKDWDRISVPC